jgi:hypothetical protein
LQSDRTHNYEKIIAQKIAEKSFLKQNHGIRNGLARNHFFLAFPRALSVSAVLALPAFSLAEKKIKNKNKKN